MLIISPTAAYGFIRLYMDLLNLQLQATNDVSFFTRLLLCNNFLVLSV